ncbi:hypothetical protein ADUPG1_010483, partial [Aduncisulcus paluster]
MNRTYLRYVPDGILGLINSKSDILYDGSGKFIYSAAYENIHQFNIKTGKLMNIFKAFPQEQHGTITEAPPYITKMVQSPNNHHIIAVGYSDGSIRIFDTDEGIVTHDFRGHSAQISVLAFTNRRDDPLSSPATILISCSYDTTICMWDLVSQHGLFRLAGHTSPIICGTCIGSSKRRFFITACKNGLVKVWDMEDQRCIQAVVGHRGAIMGMVTIDDGNTLITACTDGYLRIIRIDESKLSLKSSGSHSSSLSTVSGQKKHSSGSIADSTMKTSTNIADTLDMSDHFSIASLVSAPIELQELTHSRSLRSITFDSLSDVLYVNSGRDIEVWKVNSLKNAINSAKKRERRRNKKKKQRLEKEQEEKELEEIKGEQKELSLSSSASTSASTSTFTLQCSDFLTSSFFFRCDDPICSITCNPHPTNVSRPQVACSHSNNTISSHSINISSLTSSELYVLNHTHTHTLRDVCVTKDGSVCVCISEDEIVAWHTKTQKLARKVTINIRREKAKRRRQGYGSIFNKEEYSRRKGHREEEEGEGEREEEEEEEEEILSPLTCVKMVDEGNRMCVCGCE